MVKKPAANPSESPDTVPPGTLTCSMPRVFLRRDFPDTRSSMSEIDGLALPEVYVYVCMYVCMYLCESQIPCYTAVIDP